MIVQITMARNELSLIKELLPIWSQYADGFVFMLDRCTDGSIDYLTDVKQKYNILEIITNNPKEDELIVETDIRQKLFDSAFQHSNKIICLDADEYLDGELTKKELEEMLEESPDTLYHLQWIQYTSRNTIRVDDPWKTNFKDRIAIYSKHHNFVWKQNHSEHLPIPANQKIIAQSKLFISHLSWLDKNYSAIKQYYWKVWDYSNKLEHGVDVINISDYDHSVNNFNWEEEYFDWELKIRDDIFEDSINDTNYRLQYIKEQTQKYNIPNLGDWGFNIADSIPMYFCTAADEKHYPLLINLIGSIHKFNYYDTVEIRVYDLGFTEQQKQELKNIKKVRLCELEITNPDILTNIQTAPNRFVRGLFSWKPVLIKDSLDHSEYVLYVDAGTTIKSPLNNLFKHIKQNGYIFFDCGHSIKWMTTKYVIDKLDLESEKNKWILSDDVTGIDGGFMGLSKRVCGDMVLKMYEYSKDIDSFRDDGTCPNGFGTGRQDQTLFSILVQQNNFDILIHDRDDVDCSLRVDSKKIPFHLTHRLDRVQSKTNIFRSRWITDYFTYKKNTASIRRYYKISVITAIGPKNKYEKFIDRYFQNIQTQIGFKQIEFVIVYSEWNSVFDEYKKYSNIRFIKEDKSLGVMHAWNIGILNASAEYITYWNVDDIRFDINNVLKYDLLRNNLDVDMAYNYYIGVDYHELDTVDLSKKEYIKYPDNFHEVVTSMCMAGPDPMWRKTFHLFQGYFDSENYSIIGDWEMWIRMAKYGLKFKLIPYALCIYVSHEDTVSNSDNNKLEKQKQRLYNQYLK